MAQFIVSAAGAAVGFAIGGPTGAQIGWAIGGAIGSTFGPTQKAQGPRLGDLRVTGTEYGQTIPWGAGSPRIAGQIVWASPRRETATTESAGGKGGGGGSEYTTYTYDCDLLIILTENEIRDVSRIWSNSDLVYQNGAVREGAWSAIRIYTGADEQLPDPTYEAAVGVGNAPAYRGRGYVFIQGLQLGQSGAIPNLTFEVGIGGTTDVCIVPVFVRNYDSVLGDAVISYDDTSFTTVANTGVPVIVSDEYRGEITFRKYSKADGSLLDTTVITATQPANGTTTPATFTRLAFQGTNIWGVGRGSGINILNSPTIISTPRTAVILNLTRNSTVGIGPALRLVVPINNDYIMVINPATNTFLEFGAVGSYLGRTKYVQDFTTERVFCTRQTGADNTTGFLSEVNWPDADGFLWSEPIRKIDQMNIHAQSNRVAIATDIVGFGQALVSYRLGPEAGDGIVEECGRLLIGGFSNGQHVWSFSDTEILTPTTTSNRFARYDIGGIEVVEGEQIAEPLHRVITSLMLRAGYEESDFDVSLIEAEGQVVRGFVLGNIANTRSALEALQAAFFFEAAKSDKIYFRPRAATPVATVFYDDLNAKPESGPDGEPFALTVANDLEIPSQIGLTFPNIGADYQNATEYSERVFVTQDAINSVQLPVALLPSEAKGVANSMLIDQIASKASAPLSLPLDYAALEPSDVVEVQTPNRNYRMRLISRTDAAGILAYEAVVDDANALTSGEITDSDYPTQDALLQVAETIWSALDVPIFNDGANTPGYYVVAKQDAGDLWPGAVFLRSFDDVSFAQVQQFPSQNTFGDCDTTLGAWAGGYVWDEMNTLDVTVNGELSSSTKNAMLNDATINVALVGEDGSWECIRFRNAELLDVGQYRLSGLLRGFRGTEWAMDSHGAGEQFVYVTEAIRRVGTDVSQIGLLRYIKAVTAGFRADSVTSVEFTDTGVALKPFAPVNPVALADGSDVVVTWQRRTRLTTRYGGAAPGQVVPLGEAAESYEVQIFNGSTLVRTEAVTSPTYTYLAADWASDGFVSTDVATFIIAQLSESVGAGYEAETQGIIP